MKTVVVNFYSGPGAGKSTAAWEIASMFKKQRISVEYVPEYAKELVWNNPNDPLLNGSLESQSHIFEEQNRRIQVLQGKVDVVVTDSPILLGLLYVKEPNEGFTNRVFEQYSEYNNFNIFVKRGLSYEQAGRLQTKAEAQEIDRRVIRFLKENNIYYGTYANDQAELILNNVRTSLDKNPYFKDKQPEPFGFER